MCLSATSPSAASTRHWLKHRGVKFPAACRRTTLPMWPCTLAQF